MIRIISVNMVGSMIISIRRHKLIQTLTNASKVIQTLTNSYRLIQTHTKSYKSYRRIQMHTGLESMVHATHIHTHC